MEIPIFDLYVESPVRRAFVEVKGVTLEENNIVRFPDAPTVRGIKHVEELIHCMEEGYEAHPSSCNPDERGKKIYA